MSSSRRQSKITRVLLLLRRPWVLGLVVLLMLPIGYFGLKLVAWPIYKQWREKRFLQLADTKISAHQFDEANILLRQILRANPRSLPAWRTSLQVAEATNSDTKPFILQQLLDLEPDNIAYRTELATFYLQHRAIREAGNQLNMIPASKRKDPKILRLAADVAMAGNDLRLAERLLVELLKIQPGDKTTRIDLDGIRLKSNNLLAINDATDELRSMLNEPDSRLPALRLLLGSAMRFERTDEIRKLSNELKSEFNATFADRLIILSAEKMLGTHEFSHDLETVKKEAQEETSKVQMLADFLLQNQMYGDAEKWLGSLPEEILSRPEIAMRMSEALFNSRDWATLEQKLKDEKWERADFYRLALLSYAQRAQGKEKEFRDTWQLAVIGAEVEPRNYRLLLDQAERWGWKTEKLDLLWRLFQKDPTVDDIYNELIEINRRAGNTVALSRVFQRRIELKPGDDLAKNNFAFLSLLLNTNLAQAFRYAHDAYTTDPTSPFKATTYAFAFLKQGRPDDALDVINKLSQQDRERPERALYVGAIYAAKERWDDASKALAHVQPSQLLPEEKQLLTDTRDKIAAGLESKKSS